MPFLFWPSGVDATPDFWCLLYKHGFWNHQLLFNLKKTYTSNHHYIQTNPGFIAMYVVLLGLQWYMLICDSRRSGCFQLPRITVFLLKILESWAIHIAWVTKCLNLDFFRRIFRRFPYLATLWADLGGLVSIICPDIVLFCVPLFMHILMVPFIKLCHWQHQKHAQTLRNQLFYIS